MFREGDRTVSGAVLHNFTGRRCWEQVLLQSDYHKRLTDITEFNRSYNKIY